MSIEYLNIKEVPNDKAKEYFMRKIGKEFLLGETPTKEEFAAYTNTFSEKWALGAFELSKYLIEAGAGQLQEDHESKLRFLTRNTYSTYRSWATWFRQPVLSSPKPRTRQALLITWSATTLSKTPRLMHRCP